MVPLFDTMRAVRHIGEGYLHEKLLRYVEASDQAAVQQLSSYKSCVCQFSIKILLIPAAATHRGSTAELGSRPVQHHSFVTVL